MLTPMLVANIAIKPDEHRVSAPQNDLNFTKKEFQLFQYFLVNHGRVISRNMLLEKVWQRTVNPFTNTIDMHIANLRKKLHTVPGFRLKTIYGVGFKLEVIS